MDRSDIPLWPIKEPGTYETRDGRATEVVGKFSEGYWVGGTDDDLMTWDDSGRQRVATDREPSGDIIGPWIEGGLPFDEILPDGDRDQELLRRFKDAAAAGVGIECIDPEYNYDRWQVVPPLWVQDRAYRLHGSTADIVRTPSSAVAEPDQSHAPVTEQRVCEIVAAAFDKFATPVSLKAVASWLRNGMKD